jgi:alanine racemase
VNVSTKLSTNRARVEIDLANLVANARTVQAAAQGAPLLPMVKADAYGLGVLPVVRALEAVEPWGYGVATVAEGIELREAGIRRPILVLTPPSVDLLAAYRDDDLRAVLDEPALAKVWDRPFHVEIDTGMARCGVRWDDTDGIAALESERLEGIFTHFYAADQGRDTVDLQWSRFQSALAALDSRPSLVHAQNSAGAWRLQERLDLVRPGIFLYGGEHAPDLPPPLPVARLEAPVVSLRRLPRGEPVSYGGTWTAPRDTTVATLGIGYADGVPCAVQGKAQVLLGSARRPLVGRVTMDFVMVDLEDTVPSVRVGDVATLVGRDGDEQITIDEFAGWAGTIAYEVLTRLRARAVREYVNG